MVQLYPEQIAAVKKLRNGSILAGGVGSGKSRTSLAYWFLIVCEGNLPLNGTGDWEPLSEPKDVYVITTAKKRDSLDWEREALHFGLTTNRENSFGGVRITVDSWNNVSKYTDVRNAFFIFDEQRLVGKGAWVKSFYEIAKRNDWILLSATPGDTWLDYIPVFVANGFYRNRTDFIRRHVVWSSHSKFPKVERYVERDRLNALRNGILVEIPIKRHTVRRVVDVQVDYDRDRFDRVLKQRWNVFTDEPIKDSGEYFRCMRRVVNENPERVRMVSELRKRHPRIIIFYTFNYELALLRAYCESQLSGTFKYAEWNGHRHEDIPDSEGWIYLVQYTSGAEGWNCTTTDTVVFFSLTYSYKLFEQAMGRIDRLDTPFELLYYYILMTKSPMDLSILKALNSKKSFNERDFG